MIYMICLIYMTCLIYIDQTGHIDQTDHIDHDPDVRWLGGDTEYPLAGLPNKLVLGATHFLGPRRRHLTVQRLSPVSFHDCPEHKTPSKQYENGPRLYHNIDHPDPTTCRYEILRRICTVQIHSRKHGGYRSCRLHGFHPAT